LDAPLLAARRLAWLFIIFDRKKKTILQTAPPIAMTSVAAFSQVGVKIDV